ncbi:uncharacterized protein LOC128208656 [Mya arenaria]|uniref:uncharacterized protein LOC128208656 n=1 Tax=Mya arenaria TaxID=6604 RepID=UPI0022E5D42B|nr:uncharacterized protein LOC128208656 [Mya arenaria]
MEPLGQTDNLVDTETGNLTDRQTTSQASNSLLLKNDETLQLTAARLYHSQREVAHYLELGYLNLVDHPYIAKEVRLTAHDARAQHMMTSGLMKKVMLTSNHVVKTLLVMIRDAVDLRDADIVRETFGQIITIAEDMKNESEKTKESYYKIQGRVQENLGNVDKRNIKVKQTNEKKMEEKKLQEQKRQNAEEIAEKLKEELANLDTMLKDLRSKKKDMGDDILTDIEALDNDEITFVDIFIVPFCIEDVSEAAKSMVESSVSFIKDFLKDRTRQRQIRLKREQCEVFNSEDRMKTDQRKQIQLEEQIQRDQALERHAIIEKLNRDLTVGLGDVQNLKEAAIHLGDVDRIFSNIIKFWEDMAAATKYLKDDTKAGEVYLKKIEDERYQTRFLNSVKRAEQNWGFLGQLCGSYVVETDKEIEVLYEFLSKPLDSMSANDREIRKEAILSELKKEIDAVYPQIEDITD